MAHKPIFITGTGKRMPDKQISLLSPDAVSILGWFMGDDLMDMAEKSPNGCDMTILQSEPFSPVEFRGLGFLGVKDKLAKGVRASIGEFMKNGLDGKKVSIQAFAPYILHDKADRTKLVAVVKVFFRHLEEEKKDGQEG